MKIELLYFFYLFSIGFFIHLKNNLGYLDSLTLTCLIIKFHGLIQFAFCKITLVSKLDRIFYMLTREGSGLISSTFFGSYFFSSILSFNILFTRNWFSIFSSFFFSLNEIIAFSFYVLICYQIRFFNICFLKRKKWFVISILSFNIWLIENWSSCFFFYFFFYGVISWLRC